MTDRDKSETGWESFERLLQAARKGDHHAMNQIIDECRDYLLLVANQEIDTAIQAKLGASDLVQQSLAEIPGHLAQFRGASRDEFLGWIRQILMNDLQDARRRYKTSRRREVSREQSILDSVGNERPITDNLLTPSSQAMQDEQAQLLQAAMVQLPRRQQQIIQLRNWSQMSFVDIGHQLEISPDAARKMWYRAIVKLQGLLRPQFDSRVTPRSFPQEPDDD